MRRILAILLLAIFGLTAAAPALGDATTARIPACCKRTGAHHCMGNMTPATNAPTVSALCPHFPQPSSNAPSSTTTFTTPRIITIGFQTALTPTERAETQRRISRERSRHKRGPPTILL